MPHNKGRANWFISKYTLFNNIFLIVAVPLPGLALVGEAGGEEVEVHHALQAAQGGHTLNKIIIQPLP